MKKKKKKKNRLQKHSFNIDLVVKKSLSTSTASYNKANSLSCYNIL